MSFGRFRCYSCCPVHRQQQSTPPFTKPSSTRLLPSQCSLDTHPLPNQPPDSPTSKFNRASKCVRLIQSVVVSESWRRRRDWTLSKMQRGKKGAGSWVMVVRIFCRELTTIIEEKYEESIIAVPWSFANGKMKIFIRTTAAFLIKIYGVTDIYLFISIAVGFDRCDEPWKLLGKYV